MKAAFNHIGIGVADIQDGIRFYTLSLDCRIIQGPRDVHARDVGGAQAVDVLKPPGFSHMRIAHLVMPDSTGIELFQLIDPPHEPRVPQLEYWKSGLFHFCFTDPDLLARLALIKMHGGGQLSEVWQNGAPDMRMVYCCDPWGTIIEIYSHSYVDMYRTSH
ncbi:VOC family protein [Mesorhizobium sp. M0025]|uniref:VOC family protein n=1 Tax=Mesorhizobium sp. M0025 TaxID=2956846 RepID=UPI00333D2B5E